MEQNNIYPMFRMVFLTDDMDGHVKYSSTVAGVLSDLSFIGVKLEHLSLEKAHHDDMGSPYWDFGFSGGHVVVSLTLVELHELELKDPDDVEWQTKLLDNFLWRAYDAAQ